MIVIVTALLEYILTKQPNFTQSDKAELRYIQYTKGILLKLAWPAILLNLQNLLIHRCNNINVWQSFTQLP